MAEEHKKAKDEFKTHRSEEKILFTKMEAVIPKCVHVCTLACRGREE